MNDQLIKIANNIKCIKDVNNKEMKIETIKFIKSIGKYSSTKIATIKLLLNDEIEIGRKYTITYTCPFCDRICKDYKICPFYRKINKNSYNCTQCKEYNKNKGNNLLE